MIFFTSCKQDTFPVLGGVSLGQRYDEDYFYNNPSYIHRHDETFGNQLLYKLDNGMLAELKIMTSQIDTTTIISNVNLKFGRISEGENQVRYGSFYYWGYTTDQMRYVITSIKEKYGKPSVAYDEKDEHVRNYWATPNRPYNVTLKYTLYNDVTSTCEIEYSLSDDYKKQLRSAPVKKRDTF